MQASDLICYRWPICFEMAHAAYLTVYFHPAFFDSRAQARDTLLLGYLADDLHGKFWYRRIRSWLSFS